MAESLLPIIGRTSGPRLSKVGVFAFAGTTACGFAESVDANIGYRGEKGILWRGSGYRGEHADIAASLGGISCRARVSCR
jgi:hypothetical protein